KAPRYAVPGQLSCLDPHMPTSQKVLCSSSDGIRPYVTHFKGRKFRRVKIFARRSRAAILCILWPSCRPDWCDARHSNGQENFETISRGVTYKSRGYITQRNIT